MSLPIMNYFMFDGRDSREWKIGLSGTGVFSAPARDVSVIDIPGRSGSAIIDNGRYNNITVTYPCWIARGFDDQIDDFRAFVSDHGDSYYRLEDSYHPDEFRMGMFLGPFEPVPGTRNVSGRFEISFNCQPQRWLKEGEEWLTGTALFNPTRFAAYPIIRVRSTGEINYNGTTITVLSMEEQAYLDIDTYKYAAYNGDTLYPTAVLISATNTGLVPGDNTITATVSGLEIQPRWWTL